MKLWIARDKTNYIGIYYEKPIWKETKAGIMDWEGPFMGYLTKQSFPEVTFQNSPQEVELKLVSEIVGITESPSKTFSKNKRI